MSKKNSFIYNENPNLGRMLMVEGEDNTTEIYKVKEDKSIGFTLNAPWWDLDGLNREVKKNEKAIQKALNTHHINGIYSKIDALVEDYKNLDAAEQAKVRLLLRDHFNF
jgi:hypothetical protein